MENRKELPCASLAYLAGFFDGEGCITASKQWIKGKYEKYPRINLQVLVTNTYMPILQEYMKHFGGSCLKHKHGKKWNKPHYKECYRWRVSGRENIEKFLITIIPFLIEKKPQAEAALRFCSTMRTENLGCVPLTSTEHEIREEVFNFLKSEKGN